MVTALEIAPQNNTDLQTLKNELAEKYIKDIKSELNIVQQAVFLVVESKVKKLLLETNPLP